MEPRDLILAIETTPKLPAGAMERFSGFGVMGLTFSSGHVLALRRFPASSVGPGYSSIWHRNPTGQWTFYADARPKQACTRFFGTAVAAAIQTPIHLSWVGPRELVVRMDNPGFTWSLRMRSTGATRIMNHVAAVLPSAAWSRAMSLRAIGRGAGVLLKVGRVALLGSSPNGQRFIANPRVLWLVEQSRAVLAGHEFGSLGPVYPQARLGDFWIPQRGILAIGQTFFDPFNPSVHSSKIQQQDPTRSSAG
jgi:hypothetical protein